MEDQGSELDWATIKAAALRALDAAILVAAPKAKGVLVQQGSVPWPPTGTSITLVPGPARGVFWKECQFFAVDADLTDGPDHRQPLDHPVYNPSTKTLRLVVPKEARAALGAATRVRIYRADDQDLKLKLQLRTALTAAARGPRVVDLWSHQQPRFDQPAAQLTGDRDPNPGQQKALAAMTSEGGYYVWGPPGTGKTTVITGAVRDALRHGRSVLLSSHTHVAVDNVLEALIDEDRKSAQPLLEPGIVVRNAPGDETKILPAVREHPHLLLDKAAAAKVNLTDRSESLRKAKQDNESDQRRQAEPRLRSELDDAGIDIVEVRALTAVMQSWHSLGEMRERLEVAEDREQAAAARKATRAVALHRYAGAAGDLQEVQELVRQGRGLCSAVELTVRECGQSCRAGRQRLVEAQASLATADAALQGTWSMVLPWIATRRRRHLASCELEVGSLREEYDSATRALAGAERERNLWAQQVSELEPQLERATQRAAAAAEAESALDASAAEERVAKEDADQLRSARETLQKQLETEPDAEARLAALGASGACDLVARYDLVLAEIAELDAALADLTGEMKKLQDEYRATREMLLAEAPVIATTLTSLTFNPQLARRRFNVVIIDEAASAEAASIIYAGSRAERTLALVGDFLQNAPIAEVDDPVDHESRKTAVWQSADIFGLAGIHDRWSAERHPRCVALVRQYRYPSIIGDLVNSFCYAGLLESHRESKESDGSTIIFIDTSHAGVHLERRDQSWICRPTQAAALLLALQIIAGHPSSSTLGYLSPYAPQALSMESQFARAGLAVPAGTAHRFQGREFDRVIIDLMQDDQPRWVAAADLGGTARAVSAAKLLNVALTRGKEQTFLIGNWPFVVGCDSPGMRALAELEGKGNFEIRRLEDWL